jgi:N-acetylglucosamine-6-sulfatase
VPGLGWRTGRVAGALAAALASLRFKFQQKLALGLLALSLGGLALTLPASEARAASRPNVIVIQADDQTASQFTPDVMPRTYKFLVDPGTSFRNYIATTALCCPSRASLLTGQYAHNHGVFNNRAAGGYGALIDKANVLPVWLQQVGYTTIHVGKFLNGYSRAVPDWSQVAPGWDEWQTLSSGSDNYYDYNLSANGRPVHKGTRDRDYVTRVLSRRAIQAIHQYAPSRHPFYLQLDERAPHVADANRPGRCGGGTRYPEPDPKDMGKFRKAALPKSPAFNELSMADKPGFLQSIPELAEPGRAAIKEHWRCALASLVGVDRAVGRVVNAVQHAGELRRTVFIYISDNGQFYGEHRLVNGKVIPYEEALHEPLVIRLPKRYRDSAQPVRSSGEPVANIDLAPTILDLVHGTSCPPSGKCRTLDGRSLMPLLDRSGRWPPDRALLTEYRNESPGRYATCDFDGIRTKHGIYVEHYRVVDPTTHRCQEQLEVERYDLRDDPHELKNLCYGGLVARCPASRVQAKLARRLRSLRQCAGIAGRDERVDGRPYCR